MGPFATTSIARQDASSLLPDTADLRDFGPGRYLAAIPQLPIDLASLEAVDLYGSGRGPIATPGLFDGGSLMVLDLPEEPAESEAKEDQPPPFVDRTLKGDRQEPRAARTVAPAVGRAPAETPDPFVALPPMAALLAPDLSGLNALPRLEAGLVEAREPRLADVSPKSSKDATSPASRPVSAARPKAGATELQVVGGDARRLQDGSTPRVSAIGATSPAGDAPLAVAALPVTAPGAAPTAAPAKVARVALTPSKSAEQEGETVATRGDLGASGVIETRVSHRVLIPEAELARAEQCLAEAIYFEARGESREGQYAVAQVVMNRTRSGYYPADVCGVVYQNKHRRNACQFSFACDYVPDRVTNRYAWNLATSIARDVTRGGAWLPEVGDSTHYHATYVRPNWIRDMVKEERIGRHIFYRVRWRGPIGA